MSSGERHGHRGTRNLREALLTAALDILHNDGLEKLTLRRVAAQVGVSHAAPAHHFRGLPHLLGALCGIGFDALSDRMEAAMAEAGNDPSARLCALCEAYVGYAVENPGLISLMFNYGKERVEKAAFGQSGQRAYSILRLACAPFQPVGKANDSLETQIWSLIHGFAFLTIGGRFDNPGRTTARPMIQDILPPLTWRETAQKVKRAPKADNKASNG
ncbi:MAG: TetR/AcrR family transcriptional regulator [Pseudomonadota bacterium]